MTEAVKKGRAMTKQERQKQRKVTIEENPSGIKGLLTLDEEVVSTIAGLASRDVEGIHAVGKSSFISFGDDPTRGIKSDVGQIQAAFDVDIITEYGADIRKVAKELRTKLAAEVSKMAGREVVEINVNVVDIKLPDEVKTKKSRVV
jgi:uncharacterized alkaline shock family protein YloU